MHFTSSGPFVYSGESLLLGPTYILLLQAFYDAKYLYARRKSRYYVAFLVLVVLRIFDIVCNSTVTVLDPAQSRIVYYIQIILEWVTGNLLPILNLIRLNATCKTTYPKLVRVLVVCTTICLIFHNTSVTMYIINWTLGVSLENDDMVFAIWSVMDAVLNATVSFAFVMHLEKVVGDAHSSHHTALRRTLFKVKLLLASDATIIMVSDGIQLGKVSIDPMWSLYYFAESYRLCMLAQFLVLLNQVMRPQRMSISGPRVSSVKK
ncbi:hypothetical protein BC828DRAFT_381759 [Blastocladiella britannica]|nr:hypothetical protein BC828DRAFT_381759 [Blastocladiella britannica]